MPWIKEIAGMLEPIHAGHVTLGNGGMDVMELIQGGVPVMDLVVDRTRYFWYHHSDADTVRKPVRQTIDHPARTVQSRSTQIENATHSKGPRSMRCSMPQRTMRGSSRSVAKSAAVKPCSAG